MIKDKAKFTKQDKNHDTIILMKIIIIFLNNCPQKNCRRITFSHINKTLLYSMMQDVRKVARKISDNCNLLSFIKYIRIFIKNS